MPREEEMYLDRTLEDRVPELRPYLNRGAHVLDVGCGPGAISLDVAEAVKPGKLAGIDSHEESIKTARALAKERKVGNATFQVMSALSLDFPNDTFDLVYSHTALHSIEDAVQALREQRRVAKEGGWVIAAGVRDWGWIPRYPACPAWEKAQEAHARYAEQQRQRFRAGEQVRAGSGPYAARQTPGWFHEAGLTDLRVEIKPYRVQYNGAEGMKPHPIDHLPTAQREDWEWYYEELDERYKEMIDGGFIDEETLRRAVEEQQAWYKDPRACHFWAYAFVAGRA